MEKHAQSWVYRCVEPQCGLTGVVNEADLQSLQTTRPVTCPYTGHTMDRVRKATDEDQKSFEPLTPVVPVPDGPVILQADPWWPMEHMRVVSTRIMYGLGGIPDANEYTLPTSPDPSENLPPKDGISGQETEQADESDIIFTGEAAILLKTTQSRTTYLARSGVIPAFKVGKKEWRYSRKALEEWVLKQVSGCVSLPESISVPPPHKQPVGPNPPNKRKEVPTDLSPEAIRKGIRKIRQSKG